MYNLTDICIIENHYIIILSSINCHMVSINTFTIWLLVIAVGITQHNSYYICVKANVLIQLYENKSCLKL